MTVQGAVLRALRKPRGTAAQGFGKTSRVDNWAIYPIIQGLLFTFCAGYLTFSGILWGPLFGPQIVQHDGYLSPLFSPLIVWPDMPTWPPFGPESPPWMWTPARSFKNWKVFGARS